MTILSKLNRGPMGWLKVCAAFFILASAPLAFETGDGNPAVQEACAKETGTCCPSETGICNAGGEDHYAHYYKAEGDC